MSDVTSKFYVNAMFVIIDLKHCYTEFIGMSIICLASQSLHAWFQWFIRCHCQTEIKFFTAIKLLYIKQNIYLAPFWKVCYHTWFQNTIEWHYHLHLKSLCISSVVITYCKKISMKLEWPWMAWCSYQISLKSVDRFRSWYGHT